MVGAGAANIAISRVLISAGVNPKNIIMADSKGILHSSRKDLEKDKQNNPVKWDMCLKSNSEGRTGSVGDALKNSDIVVKHLLFEKNKLDAR